MSDRIQTDKILFSGEDMIDAYQTQLLVEVNMETAYRKALTLYNEISVTDKWEGTSKDAFQAFLHLMLQFHGALINADVPNGSKLNITYNFCERSKEAFRECHSNIMDFPDNSEVLKEMEKIQ